MNYVIIAFSYILILFISYYLRFKYLTVPYKRLHSFIIATLWFSIHIVLEIMFLDQKNPNLIDIFVFLISYNILNYGYIEAVKLFKNKITKKIENNFTMIAINTTFCYYYLKRNNPELNDEELIIRACLLDMVQYVNMQRIKKEEIESTVKNAILNQNILNGDKIKINKNGDKFNAKIKENNIKMLVNAILSIEVMIFKEDSPNFSSSQIIDAVLKNKNQIIKKIYEIKKYIEKKGMPEEIEIMFDFIEIKE